MFKTFASISVGLFFLTGSAFAGPITQSELTSSVKENTEIKGVVAAIASARKLKCGIDSDTAKVTPSQDPENEADTFEIQFFCNDINQGANVHRLEISGYVAKMQNGKIQTFMTNLAINASE